MLGSARSQELIALSVVAVVALRLLTRALRRFAAPPLSQWLLKKGRVKLAMRVRGWGDPCRRH